MGADGTGKATGGRTATRLISSRTPRDRVLAHRLRTWVRTVDTATFIWAAICGVENPWHKMPSTCSSVIVRPWLRAKKQSISESETDALAKTRAANGCC